MTTGLLLVAWGVVVGLDLVTVGQMMLSRPIVAGTVAGAIVGDVHAGALLGMLLELFALDVMPVGAVRYPDYGIGAVAGTAAIAGAVSFLELGLGVTVGLVVAYLGQGGMVLLRRRNSEDARRNRRDLDRGSWSAVSALQWRGVVWDAWRAVVVTAAGLGLAVLVRTWPPLTPRAQLFVTVVLAGGAVGTAGAGALRLSGRGHRLGWLAVGLAVGTVWVVV